MACKPDVGVDKGILFFCFVLELLGLANLSLLFNNIIMILP